MRILLTNDDGIYAPGIAAMAKALAAMGQVTVAAPDVEQSAVSHSITLSLPLRVREVQVGGATASYGVSGSPADCVKLGVLALCDERPDVVISGINLGANVGIDVFYSGTVAAAMEAAFVGIPSIAASVELGPQADLTYAAEVVCKVLLQMDLTARAAPVLNVNVPARPRDQVKGIRLTRQCMKGYVDRYVKRRDPRGREYFWLDGDVCCDELDRDTDVVALREGLVSVTPLRHDLTDVPGLRTMEAEEKDT